MQILVTGGDGFVGRHICAELAERGHDVTSLSRDPDRSVLPEGAGTASGDVTDYASIEPAFEGQDAVVNLVALPPMYKPDGGDEMHERVHLGGTENVVEAAESHGVSRIVQMSANGADPNGPTHYIRAKGRAEAVVRSSDLDWVIFRPSVIFGDGDEFTGFIKQLKRWFAPGLPIYPLPGGGRQMRIQPIWSEDMASIMADGVEDDTHLGNAYGIGGPEVFTLREVTKLVFESEGKSVTIVPLPMPLAKLGLTTMGTVPQIPLGRDQYRSLTFDNTLAENDVTAFGIDPASLKTLPSFLGVE